MEDENGNEILDEQGEQIVADDEIQSAFAVTEKENVYPYFIYSRKLGRA